MAGRQVVERAGGWKVGPSLRKGRWLVNSSILPTFQSSILPIFLALFALAPLLYPGYFQTHAGFVPPWNVADLRANLGNLAWTPHVAVTFDPLRSDGLLPYYLAALLPFAPFIAVKVGLGLGLLLGSLGMYSWLKSRLGRPGAVVAAAVYTYLPFTLATVYVRGAPGEALFWGLLPWALWGVQGGGPPLRGASERGSEYPGGHRSANQRGSESANTLADTGERTATRLPQTSSLNSKLKTSLAPVGPQGGLRTANDRQNSKLPLSSILHPLSSILLWLLLGLSHLGLTLWAFIFAAAWVRAAGRSWRLLLAALGGSLLAAFLTLTRASVPPSPVDFFAHFVYPFQFFSAYWGFGPSRPGWNDGLPLQVGAAGLGLAIIGLVLWWKDGRLEGASAPPILQSSSPPSFHPSIPLFFLGTIVITALLQMGLAAPLWRLPVAPGYSLADSLVYPWQLSGFTGLALAGLAGLAVRLEPQFARLPLFGAVLLAILLASYPYLEPQFNQPGPYLAGGPRALWSDNRLALLAAEVTMRISGNTAGLARGESAIPLAVAGAPQPGSTLVLNVTWQPLQPFAQDWKVFVHLVTAQDSVLAQFDGQPRQGNYPTSRWIPGELIEDSYTLVLPADAPPGPYRFYLGLYDEATGARLPVPGDEEGRMIFNVQ